jgi:hypothetical protein
MPGALARPFPWNARQIGGRDRRDAMSATTDHSPSSAQRDRGRVALIPLGLSLSIFAAGSFLLCALGGFLPGMENLHFLAALYPSLDWTSPALIVAGAAWAFACGWYVALVCGGLYNVFVARRG